MSPTTPTQTPASPPPWHFGETLLGKYNVSSDERPLDNRAAVCVDEQNAAYITNAANCYPELLAVAQSIRAALNCNYESATIEYEFGARLDAAIAKATGGAK